MKKWMILIFTAYKIRDGNNKMGFECMFYCVFVGKNGSQVLNTIY